MADWIENDTAYISVVFSWLLQEAHQKAAWYRVQGLKVRAGGPAVMLQPEILQDLAQVNGNGVDALPHHNPLATFTSRGCPRRCPFCVVPLIEGDITELKNWQPRPIVCDNNLLATSRKHFDRVIDKLKPVPHVDFNQGLDARLLQPYHLERIAELDLKKVRLAWDDTAHERQVTTALHLMKIIGIPKNKTSVYVLIGYKDTPEDALYRLTTLRKLKVSVFPMRYQPLTSVFRNQYVAPHWTEPQLQRFMRYWANLRHVGSVPFEEFQT